MSRYDRRGPYDTMTSAPPLGAALSRARRRARMTQQQLADAVGIGRARIAQFETGKRDIPWPTFEAIKALVDAGGRELGAVRSTHTYWRHGEIAHLPDAPKDHAR